MVVVVVDNVVDVADGGCVGIVSGDVARLVGSLGGEGVRGVGWGPLLVCMAVSQVLGCSIDVPTLLSAVCVTALAVVVEAVWVLVSVVTRVVGSVCSRFVSHTSRSAVLPRSSPSFTPFLYPASNCASLSCCSSSI
jgi:hypothetical protein